MSKLPRISSRECVKALERAGFYFKRQQGSHIILRRDDPFALHYRTLSEYKCHQWANGGLFVTLSEAKSLVLGIAR